jgi:uncharacterized protein YdaU (DUF1376 family)
MPKKISKAPAFQFYAGDFLSDLNVQMMTMAQRGIYITLLAMEWIEGSLPSNIQSLQILCRQHPNFEEDWSAIKHCFYEKDGRLYNRRLESERNNMISYRERMSNNGKKGANARWNGKAIAEPSNKEVEVRSKRSSGSKVKLYNEEFENDFWSLYPRRDNKKRAKDKYVSLRKSGIEKDIIIDGLKSYIKQWKNAGTQSEFIPMASTWLNQERYDDELISSAKTVNNLKIKKKYNWMCAECGKEETTTKELTINEKLCSCGDGVYETKSSVLAQLSAKASSVAGKNRSEAKASTPDSLESDEKKEFEKAFSSMINSMGAR